MEETVEKNQPEQVGGPPKKSKKKWWILGGCGCLVLLILLGLAIFLGGFGIYKSIAKPVGPIKDQLQALNQGNYEKAYGYGSQAFKEATSLSDFKKIVQLNPQIFKSQKSSFTKINIEGGVATVTGTITGEDGTVTPMLYQLVKEEGKWKILNFKQSTGEQKD